MPYMSKTKEYYKLQTIPGQHEKTYKITKFDENLDMQSEYFMNWIDAPNGGYHDCQCPAAKFDCRHKAISRDILAQQQLNGEKFYCMQTKSFHNASEI